MNGAQSLTEFELRVIEMSLEGDHFELEAFRKQATECVVSKREFTGQGFFTDLQIASTVPSSPISNMYFDGVVAELRGLVIPAIFILFVVDGRLSTLEGTATQELWPNVVEVISLVRVDDFEDTYARLEERRTDIGTD